MSTMQVLPGDVDVEHGLYASLHARFIDGELRPGTLLIPSALSSEYGVSRTPVREALRRLEFEGLVVQATRGFTVRELSAQEVLEVCDAKIALEGSLAREAALKRSALDLARMHHLHQLIVQYVESPNHPDASRATRLAHIDWHNAVREAGHNRTTLHLLNLLDAQLLLSDWNLDEEDPPMPVADLSTTVEDHHQITIAIEAGNPDAAQEAMVTHLERGRDIRLNFLAQIES